MAEASTQKKRFFYLMKILEEDTDEGHGITMPEILEELQQKGIRADRKAIYSDIETLRECGMDILHEQEGGKYLYRLASREFELPELKLLVDSVQASKFISERKSRDLIRKLETLTSVYEAKQLHRQVLIAGRVKTVNESIYYSVDRLHTAINADRRIRFQYFQWNAEKEMVLRHDGAWYDVSPWHLMWDDDNYYLIGYDHSCGEIRHYRVDKMLHLEITDEPREGAEAFRDFDAAAYSKSMFGMYRGEQKTVTMVCRDDLAGVLINRFGKDTLMYREEGQKEQGLFTAVAEVAVSPQFLGWVVSLGDGIRITGPKDVVSRMEHLTETLDAMYGAE